MHVVPEVGSHENIFLNVYDVGSPSEVSVDGQCTHSTLVPHRHQELPLTMTTEDVSPDNDPDWADII